jgi:class 3 adenylate cyclase
MHDIQSQELAPAFADAPPPSDLGLRAGNWVPKVYSLRLSLGAAFVLIIVLTAAVLGATTFLSVRSQLRSNLGQRLMDLAGAAVLSLDAREHAKLRKPEDMGGETYKALRSRVLAIQRVNPDIKYVYTFRKISDTELVFVLDTGTTSADFSPLGESYKDVSPQLMASFLPPYKTRVDEAFYPDQYGIWLSGYAPLLNADGSLEAVLGLDISAAKVVAYENNFVRIIGAACLAVSILGVLAGIFFSRRISKPLLKLAADMEKIQRFDLDGGRFRTSRISEVTSMQLALDDMKKGLRSFKRYVPADVVLSLMKLQKEAVLGTSRATLSFFFSDLENFTSMTESIDPERLSEFLNDYFDAMTRALQSNQATVDKFIGDSIMAFWNAPNAVENHAYKACLAALACQKALVGVWERWRGQGIPPMRTRMGIHTGEALVGNIGYKERLSYTAIGDSVNLASRLEGLNKVYGTRILVSGSTRKELGASMTLRLIDRVVVKGKTSSIEVFELLSDRDPLQEAAEFLESWEEAMGLYEGRRWKEAAAGFASLSARRPTDGPSRLLCARCQDFAARPPAADWDGTTLMQEK